MLRYSHVLWAACLASTTIVTGCTSNSTAVEAQNRMAAMRYYDDYYGLPPQQGHAHKAKSAQNQQTSGAGARTSGMVINPKAPRTYVVKKGDTLWGIARKFLHTPSYWPEIWDKNQRIANPHQIYPGDILHFGYQQTANSMKMQPRIRVERKGHGEPLSTLAPFLAWPKVMDGQAIKNAPYILASRDDNILMRVHDTAYVRNLQQARPGERFAIYHPEKPLHDPETGKLLGHQVDFVGKARVDVVDKLSTISILDAKDAIRQGDRLLKADNHRQTLRAPIQIPRHKIRGQIVSIYEAKYLGGDCMIIVFNRGTQHGIKPGYTVGVYTDGKVIEDRFRPKRGTHLQKHTQKTQLPPEKVSEAIVYHVGDNFSYGLIVNSEREVKNGDKIGNP